MVDYCTFSLQSTSQALPTVTDNKKAMQQDPLSLLGSLLGRLTEFSIATRTLWLAAGKYSTANESTANKYQHMHMTQPVWHVQSTQALRRHAATNTQSLLLFQHIEAFKLSLEQEATPGLGHSVTSVTLVKAATSYTLRTAMVTVPISSIHDCSSQ